MKHFFIGGIKLYQYVSSWGKKNGLLKDTCVFYPTCSEYAIEAFRTYGIIRGIALTVRRILRCHPWQKHHHDPLL